VRFGKIYDTKHFCHYYSNFPPYADSEKGVNLLCCSFCDWYEHIIQKSRNLHKFYVIAFR